MFLWTAFMLGLAGSLHCVGMCGPIALALPYQGTNRWYGAGNVLLYNLGRVSTYAGLGLLIGFLGRGIFMAGLQIYFSLALGIILLLVALLSIDVEGRILRVPLIFQLNRWVKVKMAKLLGQNSRSALYGIGMLNGLLPCGLVYMAVVGAVSTGSPERGAAYMALFGLGTIPLMLSLALAGQFIDLKWRNRLRRLVPVFLTFFALLFIARGLNFEIPSSVRFWDDMGDVPMCH